MRLLHTSDWHLGKQFDSGVSRLDEQAEFLDELTEIADGRRADIVIVSGDIYDTYNPPSAAEQLFYDAMARLGKNGERPVIVIAGNHDNPERLTAARPLAARHGVVLLGTPHAAAQTGEFAGFSITAAGPGYLELDTGRERAVVITMPYPSEKRLNEVFESTDVYSRRIARLFCELSEKFRPDTVNIAAGHFYITGGETSASERDIQLGGIYAVDRSALPENAQYIAMGHLHRPQRVGGAYYCGAPMQYSKSEIGIAKSVNLADITAGGEAVVERVYLRGYKPMEQWRADSIDAAVELCRERGDENCWVFLEIATDRPLMQSEIKELHRLKKDILEITPLLHTAGETPPPQAEKAISDEFVDFYTMRRGIAPAAETVKLFLELMNE